MMPLNPTQLHQLRQQAGRINPVRIPIFDRGGFHPLQWPNLLTHYRINIRHRLLWPSSMLSSNSNSKLSNNRPSRPSNISRLNNRSKPKCKQHNSKRNKHSNTSNRASHSRNSNQILTNQ